MTQTLPLIASNAINTGGDASLLAAVGSVAEHKDALAAVIGGVDSAIDIIEKIAAAVNDPKIAQAFAGLNLTPQYGQIVAAVGRLVGADNKVSAEIKTLLRPLSDFKIGDPGVTWKIPLFKLGEAAADSYDATLGASAQLTLVPAATWPDDQPPAPLLAIGAGGKIDFGAKGSLGLAGFSLTADATASADLTCLYRADRKEYFAVAAGSRLARLPSALNLDSLWQAMAGDFEDITLAVTGSVTTGVKISLADAVAAINSDVVTAIGPDISVSRTHSSAYTLKLHKMPKPEGGFSVGVKLTRDRSDSLSESGEIGLKVDLAALTRPVMDAVGRKLDDLDKSLAGLKPYLSPGTWLRNQASNSLKAAIAAMIKDEGLKTAIQADLDAWLGLQPLDNEAVIAMVEQQITGVMDRQSVLVDSSVENAVDDAVKRVMGPLADIFPSLSAKAGDSVKTAVGDVVKGMNNDFKNFITSLTKTPEKQLTDALNGAGVKITGAVDTFDDLFKDIRDFLDTLDTRAKEIYDGAESALKQKASLRLFVETTATSGTTVEVDGLFTDLDTGSRHIFNTLLRGDLRAVADLLDTAKKPSSFTLLPTSQVKDYSHTKSQRGIEIAFLNITLSLKQLVDIDVKVITDALGNVHVATSKSLAKTITGPNSERQVTFIDNYAMVLAGKLGTQSSLPPVSLEIGVGASYVDKSLKWDDIKDFAGGLKACGLISDKALQDAKACFDGWSTRTGGKIAGRIAATLRIPADKLAMLLKLQARPVAPFALPYEAKRDIVVEALGIFKTQDPAGFAFFTNALEVVVEGESLYRHGFKPPKKDIYTLSDFADCILHYYDIETLLQAEPLAPPDHLRPGNEKYPPNHPVYRGTLPDGTGEYTKFLEVASDMLRLVDLIDWMGRLYRSTPQSDATPNGWTRDDYAAIQDSLAQDCGSWTTVYEDFRTVFKPDITRQTQIFLCILSDLSSTPVALSLTNTPAGGDPVVRTFT